ADIASRTLQRVSRTREGHQPPQRPRPTTGQSRRGHPNLRPVIRLRAVSAAKQGPVWYSQAVLSARCEYHPSTKTQTKAPITRTSRDGSDGGLSRSGHRIEIRL